MSFSFAETAEWWIEISPEVRTAAWQQSQTGATPGSRWNAYLNRLCLNSFLPWFRAEYAADAMGWMRDRQLSALWEVVNGSAILFSHPHHRQPARLILIPDDSIDDASLEVPQEWVDIPGWIGDYYFGVQVQPEADWLRIWAYATHRDLKQHGELNERDRTYCIDGTDLSQDLISFWVTCKICPDLQTRSAVTPLPTLLPEQADNLIERLGNPDITFPRLLLPFANWGALLEQEQWRSRLYERRTEQVAWSALPVQLGRWLQGQFDAAWESLETLLGSDFALSFRDSLRESDREVIQRARLINSGLPMDGQPTILVVALKSSTDNSVSVRLQLHPQPTVEVLPANLKLILRSDSGDVIQEVQSREQDNFIQINPFAAEYGETFQVQIGYGETIVTQNFVVWVE